MRVLMVNNHDLADPTAGVTQSLRTVLRWLNEAGHPAHALTTTRIDRPGVPRSAAMVPHVTRLATTHHDEGRPDPVETADYMAAFRYLLEWHQPDLVLGCNGHVMIFQALAEAKRRGCATVLALRGYGYDDPRLFTHVDAAWSPSPYLTAHYRQSIGLESTPLSPPMAWDEIRGPANSRAYLTFVNPSLPKGRCLMMRLAERLAVQRPDIPLLVIQAGQPAVPWRHPRGVCTWQLAARPADYLALTRVLVVPSVWEEPFGRVAAEAMMNGIPPVVSERGALPETVGGDCDHGARVIPLPAWMTPWTQRLPTVAEVQSWVDAVCTLWDDGDLYAEMSDRARRFAQDHYSDDDSRQRHMRYFQDVTHAGAPRVQAAAW